MPWGQVAETPEGREIVRAGRVRRRQRGPGDDRVPASRRHPGRARAPSWSRNTTMPPICHARISETPAGDELLTLIRDGVVVGGVGVSSSPSGPRAARASWCARRSTCGGSRSWNVGAIPEQAWSPSGSESEDENSGGRESTQPEADPAARTWGRSWSAWNGSTTRSSSSRRAQAVPPVPEPEYVAHSLGELLRRTVDEPACSTGCSPTSSHRRTRACCPRRCSTTWSGSSTAGGARSTPSAARGALPDKGMTVTWPRLTTAMTGLIAAQSAEKAAVVSAKVSFGEGTSARSLPTRAGRISRKQLIRRSQPSYLEAYARAMTIAWSNVTNAAFSAAVYAGGTGAEPWVATGDTDGLRVHRGGRRRRRSRSRSRPASPPSSWSSRPTCSRQVAGVFAKTSVNPTNQGGTANAAQLVGQRVGPAGHQRVRARRVDGLRLATARRRDGWRTRSGRPPRSRSTMPRRSARTSPTGPSARHPSTSPRASSSSRSRDGRRRPQSHHPPGARGEPRHRSVARRARRGTRPLRPSGCRSMTWASTSCWASTASRSRAGAGTGAGAGEPSRDDRSPPADLDAGPAGRLRVPRGAAAGAGAGRRARSTSGAWRSRCWSRPATCSTSWATRSTRTSPSLLTPRRST